jgi:HEAT repeat protein
VESLIETLAAAAAPLRAASAWALGEIEDESAVPALARALAQDPDPAVRVQAALALGEMW